MRMIDKIMRSMRDTGLLDGMNDEDCDTLATAALEGMREPTMDMLDAIYDSEAYYVGIPAWRAAIDAALNE